MSYGQVPPPPPSGGYAPQQYPGYPPPQLAPRKRKPVVLIVSLVAVAAVLFVVFLVSFIFTALKSTEPYKHAVYVAKHDSRAVAKLGSPIQPGFFLSGSMNTSGPSGHADLAIPIHGSAHSGTVYVVAEKSAGEWSYQRLELAVDDESQRINFLTAPSGEN